MKKILYVDAFAGASGDMILGALVDLGVPLKIIRDAVETLPVEGWRLSSRRVDRYGIAARLVRVGTAPEGPGRGWKAISRILRSGSLPGPVRDRALRIFRRLLEAEARVHGRPFEKVHLHEAGAVDAIIDVVGACAALQHLAPDIILVSPLVTGGGTVRCQHGEYPVPAPATACLLEGVPATSGGLEGERLTPTGAAILTTVADGWGPMPAMVLRKSGYGSGTREFPGRPNVLRMMLGESRSPETGGEVVVVECAMDDAVPQVIAHTAARLLDQGALDVWTTPVQMKKGRAGLKLTVLAREDQFHDLAGILLEETGSLGLRYRRENRLELDRKSSAVKTAYGTIRIKTGLLAGKPARSWPEYEDCAEAARSRNVPLREVQDAALAAWRKKQETKRRGK
ncbi:MAG: nickel pincer cofactor biosynthesis protein LarC [Acidobacteria bacterium]|uniref:Putative nickel insertion protein n=1 Tax=Candidatus Polarisedimenticola svalbardensis TaxID=2886004 RepID=A0A8J7CK38_9BACT|nr:nickel pincer cofactor biosynthesis protein LarC [Candidatus Polarisedimenticola svalbardensis]